MKYAGATRNAGIVWFLFGRRHGCASDALVKGASGRDTPTDLWLSHDFNQREWGRSDIKQSEYQWLDRQLRSRNHISRHWDFRKPS